MFDLETSAAYLVGTREYCMAARILCIGYDPALSDSRKWILEQAGHMITSTSGTVAAKQLAASGKYDLVIIGHDAPYHERAELARWIKQKMPAVPILALQSKLSELMDEADYNANVYDTNEWLELVAKVLR